MRTFSILLFLSCIVPSLAGSASLPPLVNADTGTALHGYDAVSYFQKTGPVEGKKNFVVKQGDANYFFSSAENRDAFMKAPEQYLPAYGGWCAYAIGAKDDFVDVDPKSYKIANGKLLLFYKDFFTSTLKKWNEKETELVPKAEANWKQEQAKRGVK